MKKYLIMLSHYLIIQEIILIGPYIDFHIYMCKVIFYLFIFLCGVSMSHYIQGMVHLCYWTNALLLKKTIIQFVQMEKYADEYYLYKLYELLKISCY